MHSSLIFKPWFAADCRYEGLNLTPSNKMAAGTNSINEIMVIIEKRLILSNVSSFLTMNFLLRTLRDWLVTLEAIALQKPIQLKDASVKDANATPPTTGMRENTIQNVGHSPRKRTENKTVKKGSIALMV